MLSFLGDVGGLFEALFFIGYFFVGFFTHKLFMSKIVKKVYHIRKYDNIQYELKKKKSKNFEE